MREEGTLEWERQQHNAITAAARDDSDSADDGAERGNSSGSAAGDVPSDQEEPSSVASPLSGASQDVWDLEAEFMIYGNILWASPQLQLLAPELTRGGSPFPNLFRDPQQFQTMVIEDMRSMSSSSRRTTKEVGQIECANQVHVKYFMVRLSYAMHLKIRAKLFILDADDVESASRVLGERGSRARGRSRSSIPDQDVP